MSIVNMDKESGIIPWQFIHYWPQGVKAGRKNTITQDRAYVKHDTAVILMRLNAPMMKLLKADPNPFFDILCN